MSILKVSVGFGTRLFPRIKIIIANCHLRLRPHTYIPAAGVSGPELLFQATSEEMIEAYSHVPRPVKLGSAGYELTLILPHSDLMAPC